MNFAIFIVYILGALIFQVSSARGEHCYDNDQLIKCMENIDFDILRDKFMYTYIGSEYTWTTDGHLEAYQDELCEMFLATVDCGAAVSEECEDFMRSEGDAVTFKDAKELTFTLDQC